MGEENLALAGNSEAGQCEVLEKEVRRTRSPLWEYLYSNLLLGGYTCQ